MAEPESELTLPPEKDIDYFDADFFYSMVDQTKRVEAAKKKVKSHPLYGRHANYSNSFADSDLNDDKLQKTFKEAVDHYLALEAESEAMHKSNWTLKHPNEPYPWGDSSVNDKSLRRRRMMEQAGLRVGSESRLEQGNTDMQ